MQDLGFFVSHDGDRLDWPGASPDLTDMSGAAFFGVVEQAAQPLLEAALENHRNAPAGSKLTLIVPSAAPPCDNRHTDPDIVAFIATADLFPAVAGRPPETWCFHALRRAVSGPRLTCSVSVMHTRDATPAPSRMVGGLACDAILAHRGPERYLRVCVDSLRRQSRPASVVVGLDQKYPCPRFLADIDGAPDVRTFQVAPNPVGPYAVMHVLSNRSSADFIVRQDSDDVALARRVERLVSASRATGAGLVGSHEIQLDEVAGRVVPKRYPLDVNDALKRAGPRHQTLLPTTVATRDLFREVSGFSTDRIFGYDVDFWLKASFLTQIANVDEFLYLRRRHPNSLTRRPDIGNESPIRQVIRERRRSDFVEVVAGRLDLAQSSLAIRHRPGFVEFRDMTTGEREQVRMDDPA